jgi:RNA polymerase sigma-70 factor (ECF subfamily)
MNLAMRIPALPRTRADQRLRDAIERNYDGLWRFVRRLGVEEADAEDAVQQVLAVFSKRLPTLDSHQDRSFLFGTALRTAADFRRKAYRSNEEMDEPRTFREADPRLDAEGQLAHREQLHVLDRVLGEIGADFRVVFVLAEIEELTMSEISESLAIPPGTVASRLRRARELFEEKAAVVKARFDQEVS